MFLFYISISLDDFKNSDVGNMRQELDDLNNSLGEDVNGMTVHDKLDELLANNSGGIKVVTKTLTSLYCDASKETRYSGTIDLSNDGISKINYVCLYDVTGASGTIRIMQSIGGNKEVYFTFNEVTKTLDYHLFLASMYSAGTFVVTILIVGE